MLINYTQGRAAILCFGGWGLQVLFHLLPRLQAAQEQRTALGAVGPDLGSVTSFGALMAQPQLERGEARFDLFRPNSGLTPSPYFVERALAGLEGRNHRGELTAAEWRAQGLLSATQDKLERLHDGGGTFGFATARNGGRATRRDIFHAATLNAERVARLLEINVLDPVRQDSLDPDDPFVQTTLYVVAPLFEPLTSALIWPTVAQLMARVGRSHISQVVGLFATGSYATDLSRPTEDGATYAALRELEALAGLTGKDNAASLTGLWSSIRQFNPSLAAQMSSPLFDEVYLLDREKSNQGLAEDSHELAVLAGNALEAFIVPGGNLYLQEQLGIGMQRGEVRPYSLIGAATDYVPVAQVLHAVNRQEESRLVREWVLHSTPDEAGNPLLRAISKSSGHRPPATLHDLGLDQSAALTQLTLRLPGLFVNREPRTVTDLRVGERFIMSPAVAAELRHAPAGRWPAAFDTHLNQLSEYLTLAVGPHAVAESWGLRADEWTLATGDWAMDTRIFPTVLHKVHHRLVDLVNESPAGLARAQDQVRQWLAESEQARQDLFIQSTPSQRELERMQRDLALREWATRYAAARVETPSLWRSLLRPLLLTALVALIGYGYLMLVGRGWDLQPDGLALLGFAVGVTLASLLGYRRRLGKVRRLRRQRLELAQTAMTAQVRAAARDSLTRLYDLMAETLGRWQRMLGEATDELQALATPPVMPDTPPPGTRATHLYNAHLNEQLWERCLTYLREQQDAAGLSSDARLDNLWGRQAWRQEIERIFKDGPALGQRSHDSKRAQTLAELIRRTVRSSVAPVSLSRSSPARADLIRALAQEFNIERMLWRGQEEAEELDRQLRALESDTRRAPLVANVQAFPRRHYVENARNRAKPTANYDVSDRLAVYGVNVDYVAASGQADSDLTHTLLDEYNLTLLPTQDPFSITFVRTVHGLGLDDLDCIRRYRAEFRHLTADEQHSVRLVDDAGSTIYI